MTEGVSIVDPRNTYIDGRASIGRDTVIYPFTVISGAVKIGASCSTFTFDIASVASAPSNMYAVPFPCPPATAIRWEFQNVLLPVSPLSA